MITICADKNQFAGSHGKSNAFKHKQMEKLGVNVLPTPIPFGDYCLLTPPMQETIERRGDKLKKQDLVADIKVVVDSKKGCEEVAMNICSSSHNRFRDEAILAQKMGATFYVLVENKDGIKSIDDVFKWQNPRMHRYNKVRYMHSIGKWNDIPEPKAKPTSGQTLAKSMLTMQYKYGCEFVFCRPDESGAKIIELLTRQNIGNNPYQE